MCDIYEGANLHYRWILFSCTSKLPQMTIFIARAADRYFVFRSRFPRVPQQPDGRQWVMQFEEQCTCFPSAEAWLLPPRAPWFWPGTPPLLMTPLSTCMNFHPSLPFSSVLSSVPDSPDLLLVIFLRIPASSIFTSTQRRDSGHSMPASHCLTALPDFCLLKKKKRAPSWELHDGLDSRYTKFIVCTQWRPPG